MTQDRDVVAPPLAEAETGVDDDPIGPHAGAREQRDPASQERRDLRQEVRVPGRALHRPGASPDVLNDDRQPGLRHDGRHRRIERQAGDVVHHVGAHLRCAPRHLGLGRVDRDEGALRAPPRQAAPQSFQHRQHAAQLFLERHRAGARARRLATDVDDRSPLVGHPQGLFDRPTGSAESSVVRERVGRDVQNAHHDRTAIQTDPSPA